MVRRYEEPIEVRARAGELSRSGAVGGAPGVASSIATDEEQVPTAFLWRGRLYVVRDVLGHWSQRRPWWREALDPREDVDPGERSAGSDGAAHVVGSLRTAADLEQDVWRVEASPGRLHQAGVYDLAREGRGDAPGSWRLLRVAD
jgi:Domain of unknown function (DUF6504)